VRDAVGVFFGGDQKTRVGHVERRTGGARGPRVKRWLGTTWGTLSSAIFVCHGRREISATERIRLRIAGTSQSAIPHRAAAQLHDVRVPKSFRNGRLQGFAGCPSAL